MRYAVIEHGVVTNVIVADQPVVDATYPGAVLLTEGQPVAIGMTWDGQEFAWPEPEPEE